MGITCLHLDCSTHAMQPSASLSLMRSIDSVSQGSRPFGTTSARRPRPLFRPSASASPQKLAQIGKNWSKGSLAGLFLFGAIQGPLLDGIHGTVHLLEYQVARVDVGGLHSSLTVPVLLGSYYLVVGILFNLLDDLSLGSQQSMQAGSLLSGLEAYLKNLGNREATEIALAKQSWLRQVLNVGVVAALLYLSAVLYQNNVAYAQIWAVLAVCGGINWRIFDGTKQGLLLSVLCAIAAPLSELVIINVFELWQYPHPNIFGSGGVPSWVACCYFFYTPAVGNLARLLQRQSSKPS